MVKFALRQAILLSVCKFAASNREGPEVHYFCPVFRMPLDGAIVKVVYQAVPIDFGQW